MVETALVALTTFFATIGPVDVAAIFAAITPNNTPRERRAMAVKGVLIATGILVVIALIGEVLLSHLGITLPAFRTAGGILLLLMGISMVLGKSSGGTSTTDAENHEATGKTDVSVFPLATPLMAGPGAMGAAILLMANAGDDYEKKAVVMGAMLAMLLFTFSTGADRRDRSAGCWASPASTSSRALPACCSPPLPFSSSSTASARVDCWARSCRQLGARRARDVTARQRSPHRRRGSSPNAR